MQFQGLLSPSLAPSLLASSASSREQPAQCAGLAQRGNQGQGAAVGSTQMGCGKELYRWLQADSYRRGKRPPVLLPPPPESQRASPRRGVLPHSTLEPEFFPSPVLLAPPL